MKFLGLTTARRSSLSPEWPTLQEQGTADIDFAIWVGLLAPAGTPRDIIARINAEVNKLLQLPDVRERFGSLGAEILDGSAEEFTALVRID
jgi:tripartite-type tricarboxylate transporter receptor subunit TctC